MSWSEHRATYFCVDIEANGSVPGLYDMVSLGAVVVQAGPDGHLEIGASIYLELAPVAPRFDAQPPYMVFHNNGFKRRTQSSSVL